MIDRELLERALRQFPSKPGVVERVMRRRDRKNRNKRITAATVALIIGAVAIGTLVTAFEGRSQPRPAAPRPAGSVTEHRRSVTLNFSLEPHPFGGGNGLIAAGRVKVPDGLNACRSYVTVEIQRWKKLAGSWKTVETALTSREGKYKKDVSATWDPVNPGKYRAEAPRQVRRSGDDICLADKSAPVMAPLG